MKSLMSIITIGIMLLAVLAVSPKANASDGHRFGNGDTQIPTVPAPKKKKSVNLFVPIMIIGAGVWCIFKCDEAPKDEPLPNPGPAVKNDITPNNVKDKPRQFIIEAN